MGENIVVNVEFQGTNMGTINEIQVVPSDIAWEDLELMLKVYAGYEEEEQLIVKYTDDDNDEITISSQEELKEAFKVAKHSNNTLQLRVICDLPGTQDGNVVVKANVMSQSVSMANSAPIATETEVKAPLTPPVVEVETAPEADEQEKEDVTKATTNEDEPCSEQCATDYKCEEIVEATANAAQSTPPVVPRRLFYIRHVQSGLVLDINGENPRVGNNVILWPRKPGPAAQNSNQLWYRENDTIRSVLNDLCLDVSDFAAIMNPYQPDTASQKWRVVDRQIRHCTERDRNLVAWCPQAGGQVAAAAIPGGEAAWQIEYIGQTTKKICTNKETGEKCAPGSKIQTCRAKVTKRSSSDPYASLAREVGKDRNTGGIKVTIAANPNSPRPTTSPKRGKKDYYAKVAKEISGNALFRNPPANPAGKKDVTPPTWFTGYMEKFKRDVTEDVSKRIARSTVREVLKGLNNAVIDTVQVTEGGRVQSVGTQQRAAPSANTAGGEKTMYCHDSVLCDSCDRVVVGARYKCGNCEDFDLCEACERLEGVHDPEHIFVKIRRPMPGLGRMPPLLGTGETKTSDKMVEQKLEKLARQEVKMQKRKDKIRRKEEKLRYKEEKLKRHLETGKETPTKKEKLDLETTEQVSKIDLEFVHDESIPDGTRVQPGTRLIKKWLVRNNGEVAWDSKFKLFMMWGNMSPVVPEVGVPPLNPDETGTISIDVIAPDEPGEYETHWRLSHEGRRYGHRVWCTIVVDPKQILEPAGGDFSMLDIKSEDAPTSTAVEMMKAASEPPTPVPRENEDAPKELPHILSYETLNIGERLRAKASQTATPNNTPRDVTPPKSPIPQLRGLSNSSSVEIVSAETGSEVGDEETISRMSELVQERMASLGLQPQDSTIEPDLEGWSSYDEDLSDDTDSDFYVVPIPDCFNPELPPASTASTSVCVKKEDNRTLDEILTTSQSLDSQPLLKPSTSAVDDITEATSAISLSEQTPKPTVRDAEPGAASSDVPARDPADYEALAGRDGDEDERIVVRVELPGGAAAAGVETRRRDVLQCDGETGGEQQAVEGAVGGIVEDQATDQNANLPLDINENSAGTPNQEPLEPSAQASTDQVDGAEDSTRPQTNDPRELSPVAGELASHVVSAARGVTSYATSMAQNVYATAKDVFQNLQVPEKPKSEWQPKDNDWTPPKSTWTPSETTWIPPPQEVPVRPMTLMDKLIEMGFGNRKRNQELLDQYGNDLEKIVNVLVSETDSDWASDRH